jgi:hypothetical protein
MLLRPALHLVPAFLQQQRSDMQWVATALDGDDDALATTDVMQWAAIALDDDDALATTDDTWDYPNSSTRPAELNPPMLPPPPPCMLYGGLKRRADTKVVNPRKKSRPKYAGEELQVITNATTGVQSMTIQNPDDWIPIFQCPFLVCKQNNEAKTLTGYRAVRKHFNDNHGDVQLINANRKKPSKKQIAQRIVRMLQPTKYDPVLDKVIAYAQQFVQQD